MSKPILARDIPPYVQQDSPRSCWAAAMESWTSIVPKKTYRTQNELFLMAAESGLVWDPVTLEMNGLLKKGIPVMAKKVGMKLAIFPASKKKQVTLTYLYNKLKNNGHVYLVYHGGGSDEGLAHAVVVYAVSLELGWLGVMDPWYGQGFQWPYLSDLQESSNYFIVGYP
jgi:hypothetical protein